MLWDSPDNYWGWIALSNFWTTAGKDHKTAQWIQKKKQSTRYHGNDKQTQMELGWACGEKNRLLLDNLHYVLDVLETHKEPGKTEDKMKGWLR